MSRATRRAFSNSLLKTKDNVVTKWRRGPGDRGCRESRATELGLCIHLHWLDQPSAISDPGDQGKAMLKDFPMVKEVWFREHPGKTDIHKSISPDRMNPWLLRELTDTIAKSLMIIFGRSWWSGEVSEDWKTVNVTPVFKKLSLGMGQQQRGWTLVREYREMVSTECHLYPFCWTPSSACIHLHVGSVCRHVYSEA